MTRRFLTCFLPVVFIFLSLPAHAAEEILDPIEYGGSFHLVDLDGPALDFNLLATRPLSSRSYMGATAGYTFGSGAEWDGFRSKDLNTLGYVGVLLGFGRQGDGKGIAVPLELLVATAWLRSDRRDEPGIYQSHPILLLEPKIRFLSLSGKSQSISFDVGTRYATHDIYDSDGILPVVGASLRFDLVPKTRGPGELGPVYPQAEKEPALDETDKVGNSFNLVRAGSGTYRTDQQHHWVSYTRASYKYDLFYTGIEGMLGTVPDNEGRTSFFTTYFGGVFGFDPLPDNAERIVMDLSLGVEEDRPYESDKKVRFPIVVGTIRARGIFDIGAVSLIVDLGQRFAHNGTVPHEDRLYGIGIQF